MLETNVLLCFKCSFEVVLRFIVTAENLMIIADTKLQNAIQRRKKCPSKDSSNHQQSDKLVSIFLVIFFSLSSAYIATTRRGRSSFEDEICCARLRYSQCCTLFFIEKPEKNLSVWYFENTQQSSWITGRFISTATTATAAASGLWRSEIHHCGIEKKLFSWLKESVVWGHNCLVEIEFGWKRHEIFFEGWPVELANLFYQNLVLCMSQKSAEISRRFLQSSGHPRSPKLHDMNKNNGKGIPKLFCDSQAW